MKYLTLAKTWRLCLLQWAWIIKRLEENPATYVPDLKREWFRDNIALLEQELDETSISPNCCFFCEYNNCQDGTSCLRCPGRLVDKEFDCRTASYHFFSRPQAFYKKLLTLHKKWQRGRKRDGQ